MSLAKYYVTSSVLCHIVCGYYNLDNFEYLYSNIQKINQKINFLIEISRLFVYYSLKGMLQSSLFTL